MKPLKFVFTIDISDLSLIEAEQINRLDFINTIVSLERREVERQLICYEVRPPESGNGEGHRIKSSVGPRPGLSRESPRISPEKNPGS